MVDANYEESLLATSSRLRLGLLYLVLDIEEVVAGAIIFEKSELTASGRLRFKLVYY